MAVLMHLTRAEQDLAAGALVRVVADRAADPEHGELLSFLRALCGTEPLIVTDEGCRVLADAIVLHVYRGGDAKIAGALLVRLQATGVRT